MAGHFLRFLHAQQMQHGRRDIGQNAALANFQLTFANINERHRLGGVRSMRLSGGVVGHLFDVAVVRGNQRLTTNFLQRLGDAPDTRPGIPQP